MSSFKLSFLTLFSALVTFEASAQSATLKWQGTPLPLTPASFEVSWDAMSLQDNDRIEVHLPRFGGTYNSFGTEGPASSRPVASPSTYGVKALGAGEFYSAEWNSKDETMKLRVKGPAQMTGFSLDQTILFLHQDTTSVPNGLGPLPPVGGIDSLWHTLAYVARFPASACSNAATGREGLGREQCNQASATFYPFVSKSELFSTNLQPLPTKRIGPLGEVESPSIVFFAAQVGAPWVSSGSCVTVTLISNAVLVTPDSAVATSLTLSGLPTGAALERPDLPLYLDQNACSAGNAPVVGSNGVLAAPGSKSVDRLMSPDGYAWVAKYTAGGELVIFLGNGFYINDGELLSFSFPLVNNNLNSATQMSVSVSGYTCTMSYLCSNIDSQPVSIASTKVQGVTTYANARRARIRSATFDVAKIYQNSDTPNAIAQITVTLQPSVSVQNQAVTISGLCGTQTNSNPTLSGPASTSFSSVDWNYNTKVMILYPSGTGLPALVTSVFSFSWTLSSYSSSPCSLQISAGTLISTMPMENVQQTVGKVVGRGFTTYSIGQYSTRPDSVNYICITLTTNYDFVASISSNAVITFSGLKGSGSNSFTEGPIFQCPTSDLHGGSAVGYPNPNFKLSFDSSSSSATVKLTSPSSWTAGSTITFAIALYNPATANSCQTVTMAASSRDFSQTVVMQQSSISRAIAGGENDGDACVLKIYSPQFFTREISQSTPLANELNTLVVSLRANVDLAGSPNAFSSSITISGLQGSQTMSTDSMPINAVSGNYFPSIAYAQWDQTSGNLVLTLAAGQCQPPTSMTSPNICMKAGFTYSFSFNLVNPSSAQSSLTVYVQADYTSSKTTLKQAMTTGSSAANAPFNVQSANQLLSRAYIGQLLPAPSAANRICMTLTPAKSLQGSSSTTATFTINGLPGYPDSATSLALYDISGTKPLSSSSNAFNLIGGSTSPSEVNTVKSNPSSGEISFYLLSPGVPANQDLQFCIAVTNPSTAVACSKVSIQVNSGGTGGTQAMVQDMMTQIPGYGYASACAGYVSGKGFVHALIRSSANTTSAYVTVIMELITNYNIRSLDYITIVGLQGFTPQIMSSGSQFSADMYKNGVQYSQAQATVSGDQWTFSVNGGLLAPNIYHDSSQTGDKLEVRFKLVNPSAASSPRDVYITAAFGFSFQKMQSGFQNESGVTSASLRTNEQAPSSALSAGGIAGIVVGTVAGVALLGGGAFLSWKYRVPIQQGINRLREQAGGSKAEDKDKTVSQQAQTPGTAGMQPLYVPNVMPSSQLAYGHIHPQMLNQPQPMFSFPGMLVLPR